MQIKPAFRLLNILTTVPAYDKPLQQIEDQLKSLTSDTVMREPAADEKIRSDDLHWDGKVLLLAPAGFRAR